MYDEYLQQEFESEYARNQHVIDEYVRLKSELFTLSQEENSLVEYMDQLAGKQNTVVGVVPLPGVSKIAKLERRQNVTYEKFPQSKISAIQYLEKDFPEFVDKLFRREYKESGKKVTKFIEENYLDCAIDCTDDETDEKTFAKLLASRRRLKSGKPSVRILNNEETEEQISLE